MIKKILTVAGMAIIGLSMINGASAESMNQIGGKFGFHVKGGYNLYDMVEINEAIDGIKWVDSAADTQKISGGLNFDAGLSYAFTDTIAVFVEAGMLLAQGYYAWESYYSYKNEFLLPAYEMVIGGKYMLPVGEQLLLNAGLGIGVITVNGTSKYYYEEELAQETVISGMGIDVKVSAGLQYFLTSSMAWDLGLGYRTAAILQLDNMEDYTSTSLDPFTVDYSGVFAQTGLSFYF